LKIQIIEPYLTGSHKAWAEGYKKHSLHDIDILGMEGRYWKWRMHGGAVTLARRFLDGDLRPDLILATDMLDLTTFLSLTRRKTAGIPVALYFHENQLSYPWSPGDRDIIHKRDRHYGFINYSSALAADSLFFNSRYHMESFITGIYRLLKGFPDYNELETVEQIRNKSLVLPLGFELKRFDQLDEGTKKEGAPPLILWNHRWEYDKNPADFFKALYRLTEKGLDFELAVLGENFRKQPAEFNEAKKRLGSRIVNFGYADNFADYARWLHRADILPVTSNQDFFGGSVVEAMYCNCHPILPKRLAYPEHIPAEFHDNYFYDDTDDLLKRLEWAISNIDDVRSGNARRFVEGYCWEKMAVVYEAHFDSIVTC